MIGFLQYSLKREDGSVAKENAEQAEELLKTFFPPLPARIEEEVRRPHREALSMPELTLEEIEEKIMAAKPWKAPGEDGLPAMAWRPISLLSTLGKIMEAVIAERISYAVEACGLLPANHFGARKRRSAEQALLLLQEHIYKAWRAGKVLSLISFDVKGAYNGVCKERLLERMKARGIPDRLVRWVGAFCSDRTASVVVNGYASERRVLAQAGLPQGPPSSPIAFLFFNADLVQGKINANGGSIAFVDDYTAWVTGPTAEENRAGIQSIIDDALKWEARSGATFKANKTAVIHFTRTASRSSDDAYLIKGKEVKPKSSVKVLGVVMDTNLRYKEHMTRAAAKGLAAALCLRRLKMLSPRTARQLFVSTVAPVVDYASSPMVMGRKESSPLAPTFMVSAPGKVIVFGEHAAVFGKPAIAAAISLRSYLLVTTLSKSQRTVKLNFKDIGLNHTWKIDTLPWDIFHEPEKKKFYYSLVDSLNPELLKAVIPHAEAVSKHLPETQRKIHVRSATAFLYLFLSLGSPLSPGFIYTLRSTIPIGAGLGSSASVCVCLSAALLLQIRTLAGPHPDQPAEEAQVQIERISRWAFVGELCIHGDPSGVDNAVSAGGKAVIYQRNYSGPPSVTPLTKFPKLPLLLVNTQQPRSTATQVDKRIRELVDYADIGWTKLTGAGGGGCAITLFRPDAKDETIKGLETKFTAEGFQKYETILGADGVAVLWPAVFRNNISGEGGEEIDQEIFENAVGVEGIEQLVGVGAREDREGWKFWTRAV
ncbi:reverse transcriptase, putative [Metarhizium acridum CQMa 102]|uniref:mevalonate kinase n=1 Tax=Metarhizium acridum (strain CQMa 102) TaxID=655827 RepID=E9EGQ8_METAQ|nr:reverse transcriptase, putative [Metarhizium acridum CQMa 102]EFY84914.1 reverse transcriptase, putative [Metarhizium acridum CQMa 102]